MVVCLKHVGITDSVRERLKMSVKRLASWSVGSSEMGIPNEYKYNIQTVSEVENVSEDTFQLVSVCTEYASW
jgi:hypothetical protein